MSVGLFLSAFLPVSAAVGGALLYLLSQSYRLEVHVIELEGKTEALEAHVKGQANSQINLEKAIEQNLKTTEMIRTTQLVLAGGKDPAGGH